jgi:hypothetical protein
VLIGVGPEPSGPAAGNGRAIEFATAPEDEDHWEADADAGFETTDATLGLEVALQLAHLNFGAVTPRSRPDGATTWELRVPLANPSLLTARYLGSLVRLKHQPSHVSLITARADLPAGSPLAGSINDFLQRLLRCTDWVYQAGDGGWLLVVAGTGGELDKIVARVHKAWGEAGRHRSASGWPGIQLEIIGTWPISDPDQEFTHRFVEKLHNTSRRAMSR